ncbi:uncharacterized protein LOC18448796 [Amborella trichopoda]|uniref:Methyltransferase-related protein n=1 Tax=Amborella trichopoda TaxID=13333 RepID=U5DCW6_AMBTC|nr:uncharacterized protein LOC18448796 [Amborella trichopoda]ERN20384.1 hypothetical protein AMTR_s00068p00049790 [Amborella trichopoda]|eukprot:XP_006858917.1 uncharacterized protein LOC18448796 [Amborella trichopoda]
MCPLRLMLVFLSATLAGYFAWRSIRSKSDDDSGDLVVNDLPENKVACSTKVASSLGNGFWTLVDMASGRYLWRNLRVKEEPKPKEC